MRDEKQRRTVVRLIFLAVLLTSMILLFTEKKVGEPYPALMMPRFWGTGGHHDDRVDTLRMEVVFVTTDGEEIPVSGHTLLADLPENQYTTITWQFLSKIRAETPAEARDRSRAGFRYRIFSGLAAGSLDRATPENVASLRAWVAQRARTLLPGRTIDRVEFRWYLDTLRIDENTNEVFNDSHLDGTLVVDLRESTK